MLAGHSRAEESLCQPGEPVVFSCHIGKKTLSLCRPSAERRDLSYRFGTPARVELAYPPPGKRARAPFTVSTLPLVAGGVTTVAFRRGQYEYAVYSRFGRSGGGDQAPEFEDGVVVSFAGKQLARMVCDDGGEGFREELGWLPGARRR